ALAASPDSDGLPDEIEDPDEGEHEGDGQHRQRDGDHPHGDHDSAHHDGSFLPPRPWLRISTRAAAVHCGSVSWVAALTFAARVRTLFAPPLKLRRRATASSSLREPLYRWQMRPAPSTISRRKAITSSGKPSRSSFRERARVFAPPPR